MNRKEWTCGNNVKAVPPKKSNNSVIPSVKKFHSGIIRVPAKPKTKQDSSIMSW